MPVSHFCSVSFVTGKLFSSFFGLNVKYVYDQIKPYNKPSIAMKELKSNSWMAIFSSSSFILRKTNLINYEDKNSIFGEIKKIVKLTRLRTLALKRNYCVV